MRGLACPCDQDFGALFRPATPDLSHFERDAVRRVIRDEPGVAQAVHEVFRAKVVRIAEPSPEADNADMNAAWVASFSRRRCHGFMANNRFRLGTGRRTTSLMPFAVAFFITRLFQLFRRHGFASLRPLRSLRLIQ